MSNLKPLHTSRILYFLRLSKPPLHAEKKNYDIIGPNNSFMHIRNYGLLKYNFCTLTNIHWYVSPMKIVYIVQINLYLD